MLQSVLFRVMNTSIIGTSRDIGFYSCDIGLWKDGGPRKIVPQDPSKPYTAVGGIAPWPRSWLKVGSVQLLNNFNSNLTLFFKTVDMKIMISESKKKIDLLMLFSGHIWPFKPKSRLLSRDKKAQWIFLLSLFYQGNIEKISAMYTLLCFSQEKV